MIGVVGIVMIFVMVFGGYLAAGGKMGIILKSLPFEMTMIGGEEFKKTFSLYNHWFRQVSPIERLTREIRNFDASKLSLEELKIVEKELKKTWAESHQILMKRAVGQ